MTVAALPPVARYIEDGVTVAFAAPFRFKAASDLIVERIVAGVVTRLVLGVDYTVTGGTTDAGGTVTRLVATNGSTLRIRRHTMQVQPMVYTTGDRFPAKSHEEALDRGILIDQEQQVQADDTAARAILFPAGEVAQTLPVAQIRADRVLGFDPVAGAPALFSRDDFRGTTGSAGGNVMAIGLFTGADGMVIPAGAGLVQTSGHTVIGEGAARYAQTIPTDATSTAYRFRAADGRWFEIAEAMLTVQMFGAIGDDIVDDTTAMQTALDYGNYPRCHAIYFNPGIYRTTRTLQWNSRKTVGMGAQAFGGDQLGVVINFQPPAGTWQDWTAACNITGVGQRISGITLTGPHSYRGAPYLVTDGVVAAGSIPNYSGLAAGCVGWSILGLVGADTVFEDCRTSGFKHGRLIGNAAGHVSSFNCSWGGLIADYYITNGGDYFATGGGWAGILASIGFSDGIDDPRGGTAGGGLDLVIVRSHSGFSPYVILQMHHEKNNGVGGGGLNLTTFRFSTEEVGECAISTLPTCLCDITLEDVGFDWNEGNYGDSRLPVELSADRQKYALSLGLVQQLRLGHSAILAGVGSRFIPSPARTDRSVARINGVLDGNTSRVDIDILQQAGTVEITNLPPNTDYTTARVEQNFVRRSELQRSAGFAPMPTLIADPETVANWTVDGPILIGKQLLQEVPQIPRELEEELGPTPVFIKLGGDGAHHSYSIPFLNAPLDDTLNAICFSGWSYTADPGGFTPRINLLNANRSPAQAYNLPDNQQHTPPGWQRFGGVGFVAAAGQTYREVFFYTSPMPLYIAGLMVSRGTVAPYNRRAVQSLQQNLALDGFTKGPAPAGAATGTITLMIDGVATKIATYA